MTRALKFVLAATLVGQAVHAQPPPAAPPGEPAAPVPAPAADTDASVRQRATLSSQEMITQATDYRGRMVVIIDDMGKQVDQARKAKDVIRLNCLLDKVTQVKANLNIADSAIQGLQEAAARRDEGGGVHEYTRVTIVHQKAQVLAQEAQACIGEDITYVGATKVDVSTEGIPDDDFTLLKPERPMFDRPPAASPTE